MTDFSHPASGQILKFIMSYKSQSSMTTNHTMINAVTGSTHTVARHILTVTASYTGNTMHLGTLACLDENPAPGQEEQ